VGLLQEQKSNCQLDLESGTNTDPQRAQYPTPDVTVPAL